jgi:predicted nucleic acid-binding protein
VEGLTFDTGVLIAIERARAARTRTPAVALITAAEEADVPITVPTAVVGEWWQKRPGQSRSMLDRMIVEPLTRELAESAGEILGKLRRRDRKTRERLHLVDAIVLASASRRRDIVYTTDLDDLERLRDVAKLDLDVRRL